MGDTAREHEEQSKRWRRLGELTLADALLESQASAESVQEVIRQLDSAGSKITIELLNKLAEELRVDDARGLLLAVIGRGASRVKCLLFEKVEDSHVLRDVEALALCVNLESNTRVEEVMLKNHVFFGSPRGCELLGNALATNGVLRRLVLPRTDMGPEAVKRLMIGFERNRSLRTLDIGGNRLLDEGVGYVADMLRSNKTLTKLLLSTTQCGKSGAEHMAHVLEHNTNLTNLHIGDNPIPKEGMDILFRPLVHDGDPSLRKNVTLKSLTFERMRPPHVSVKSLADVLRTNMSLTEIAMWHSHIKTEDWMNSIIPALEHNETLKILDLRSCRGLTESVPGAIIKLVQVGKTKLDRLNVAATEMSSQAGIIDEELRKNKLYRGTLRDQATVTPRTGRVVLCGYEFAGKTTLRRRIGDNACVSQSAERKLMWKKFLQKHPLFRQLLQGKRAYLELQDRTRGFDILTIDRKADQGDQITTSIWDFAGQREFYALHDYLFPNGGNSCFLYVCSARCPPDPSTHGNRSIKTDKRMKDEFRFWLRFIASNSKIVGESSSDDHRHRPDVTFVLTNKDTLDKNELHSVSQKARRIVAECKIEFESVISVSEDIDVIDAHSPADAEKVFGKVQLRLTKILQESTEYAVCEEVRRALQAWAAHCAELNKIPLLSVEKFERICDAEVQPALSPDRGAQLSSRVGRETVLAYLNDVGEIIFANGLEFIIVNPRWFGVDLLGQLINVLGEDRAPDQLGRGCYNRGVLGCFQRPAEAGPFWLEHQHGFVIRNEIERLLQGWLTSVKFPRKFSTQDLIQLMIHLEMCFEEKPTISGSRLFIPALFNDTTDLEAIEGKRQLLWEIQHSLGERVHFVGRRLECENASLTFLTPGFFPRLQVVLRSHLHAQEWTQNVGYTVARNLIRFAVNGMEVLVEYSGDIDFFVDILIRSSSSREITFQFLEEYVEKKILDFCASPQGCQGVQLVEAVIRPSCVHKPSICIDRKLHAVRVSTLRESLKESGEAYKHTWRQRIANESDEDFALDLLEGEGSFRRFVAASQVLQTDGSSASDRGYVDGPYQFLSQTQLPKRFFPTIEDVGIICKLESRMNLAKALMIKLHLMCDGIDDGVNGPHEVEGQSGRRMKLNEQFGGLDTPIMKYAVRLLWMSGKVAAGIVNVSLDSAVVEKWVDSLFTTEVMNIDVGMLQRMVGSCGNGSSTSKVSENDILELLKRYMEIDPETQWLAGFLNLTNSQKFYADFQLNKVKCTENAEVRWLCRPHFETGIREGRVKSVLH